MAFYTRKIVSDQFVGPLDGTATSASYATTASSLASGATASLAETASFALTASYVESSSYAFTATSASWALTASYLSGSSTTSSYALTASYLDVLATASYALTASSVLTSSYATTASFVLSSSYALSSSVAESASFASTASYVLSSSYALSSSLAESASFATSASWTLSSSFATSSSLAVSASFARSASLATSASYLINTVYDREIHVSNVSGNDSGSGTLLQPVKTIGRAMALLTSNGSKVIIHPGTYQENVTLTAANATISAPSAEYGGIVLISGSFTINNNSTSNRVHGITANHWVITGSGNIYLDQIRANHSFSKIGSGYMEVLDSGVQPTQGMVVSAGTNVFSGGNIAGLVQSGATTVTIVKNALSLTYANITQGTFAVTDSPVYSLASGSAAIVSSAGSVVQLFNTQIATPAGVPERVAISGFFGYDDISFNKDASTLGTSLGLTADFQNIRGTLIGTASFATTASAANNFVVGGNLTVRGTASIGYLKTTYETASVIYSSGSTKFGDSLDDTHIFTGSLFITGSVTADTFVATNAFIGAISGSITNAVTASYALTASYLEGGINNISGSFTQNHMIQYCDIVAIPQGVAPIYLFQIPVTPSQSAVMEYVLVADSGSGRRSGTINMIWDTNNIIHNEISTLDLGDSTADVDFTPGIGGSGTNLFMYPSSVQTRDWTVRYTLRIQ